MYVRNIIYKKNPLKKVVQIPVNFATPLLRKKEKHLQVHIRTYQSIPTKLHTSENNRVKEKSVIPFGSISLKTANDVELKGWGAGEEEQQIVQKLNAYSL